jgi:hypothetical protein
MTCSYNAIQKERKAEYNISQERIERLGEIGFQWQGGSYNTVFEKRCRELIAFKEEVGHCNVPVRCANNSGLGHWCSDIRCSYNAIQKGNKAKYNISQERIERLEEIGFQWQVLMDYNSKSFE